MAKQNVQKVKLFHTIQRFLLKFISQKFVELVGIDVSKRMKTLLYRVFWRETGVGGGSGTIRLMVSCQLRFSIFVFLSSV